MACFFQRLAGRRVKSNGLIMFPWFYVLILIYFRVIFIATFFSIIFWLRFVVFAGFVLVFGFCNFLYFFYFVKSEFGGMNSAGLWKNLLFLTHSSYAFSWLFCMAFYHSNIILIQFYWLLLLDSVLGFPALVSCILWKPVTWLL